MPSSTVTDTYVDVPRSVIAFSKEHPRIVFCNLRPNQRNKCPEEFDAEEFHIFLRTVTSETLVAIHYQHYRPELFTVVTKLKPIVCWRSYDNQPRLDFDKPANWNHCPNLWGSFVLAIARVIDLNPCGITADWDSARFLTLAGAYGITTNPSRLRRDVFLEIDLFQFQKFDRGETIRQFIKAELAIRAGDCCEYRAGSNISGIAKVINSEGVVRPGNMNRCSLVKLT